MMFVRGVAVVFLMSILTSGNLLAQTISKGDLEALDLRLSAYKHAANTGNLPVFVNFAPPRVMEELAREANVNVRQFRKFLKQEYKEQARSYPDWSIVEFVVDEDSWRYGISSTGRPYATMHAYFVADGAPTSAGDIKSLHIALKDEVVLGDAGSQKWFLMRLGKLDYVELLKKAYPDLTDLALEPLK